VVISAASFMVRNVSTEPCLKGEENFLLQVFVVFGLTKRNLELWKELLFARKAGPISINASA